MSFLEGMTFEDLASDGKIYFDKGETVKFFCTNAAENPEKKYLRLDCKVLTGKYVGQIYELFISNRDHVVAKKILAQFLKTFWSDDELREIFKNGKELKCSRIAGKSFTAKASAVRESEGSKYQGFSDFRSLPDNLAT